MEFLKLHKFNKYQQLMLLGQCLFAIQASSFCLLPHLLVQTYWLRLSNNYHAYLILRPVWFNRKSELKSNSINRMLFYVLILNCYIFLMKYASCMKIMKFINVHPCTVVHELWISAFILVSLNHCTKKEHNGLVDRWSWPSFQKDGPNL